MADDVLHCIRRSAVEEDHFVCARVAVAIRHSEEVRLIQVIQLSILDLKYNKPVLVLVQNKGHTFEYPLDSLDLNFWTLI